MKIEFYHVDAFEVANYEPIWRSLKKMGIDANMVGVPGYNNSSVAGWFDFERFSSYCTERGIPFTTSPDPDAHIAVTTQNANILREYRYRVRLMYGPTIFPSAWALQPDSVKPFDAVLTHGKAYVDQYSHWAPREKLHIIGYPRFDAFFSGILRKDVIRQYWDIHDEKPVLAFFPTWGDNTAFDTFFPTLLSLAEKYHIIIRPHQCTVRFEKQRMLAMRSSGLLLLDNALDIEQIYTGADIVLSDTRSGSLFEACMCNIPSVGMVIDPTEISGWLMQSEVDKMVTLCSDPSKLSIALDNALQSADQAAYQKQWADKHVSFRDGSAAKHAAEVLIQLAMRQLTNNTLKSTSLLTPVCKTNLENN